LTIIINTIAKDKNIIEKKEEDNIDILKHTNGI